MIPLGPGPVPSTSAELGDRLAAGVRRIFGAGAAVRVEAAMSSPQSVESVRVDATGVEISSGRNDAPSRFTSSQPAILERLTVDGSPVLVRGLPVTLAAEAENLPISWREAEDGGLWIVAEDSENTAEPASARLDADAELVRVKEAVRAELEREVSERGFVLKSLSMDIRSVGHRGLAVRADATVGKSFLSAKVSVTAEAAIDDALTLTISQVELSSSNPIVGAVVGPVNARLGPWNGRRIDLSAQTFAGARLKEVDLTVDTSIRVRARFGG